MPELVYTLRLVVNTEYFQCVNVELLLFVLSGLFQLTCTVNQ